MARAKARPKTAANMPNCERVMRELVIPALETKYHPGDDDAVIVTDDEVVNGAIALNALLRGRYRVHACVKTLDELRSCIRFSLMTGYLINGPSDAILLGTMLTPTPFHVRTDCELGLYGRVIISSDLIVRDDDHGLMRRRKDEMMQVARDLDWFFPLRMPQHLDWHEVKDLEIPFEELPHQDLAGFLDEGLEAPPSERTPLALLRLAQGLERWHDVLRLLREHPEEFPRKDWAPLKSLACRQLRRWIPAIRAAKAGGITNGRYPNANWLCPSYMLALIEGGEDIEALRLLGNPQDGEPGFYHWLRGLALHRAGDDEQAAIILHEYIEEWPNDVLGAAVMQQLARESG